MLSSAANGIFQSSLLAALANVEHGFGSRTSGSWPGEYASLKQIHSSIVVTAPGEPGREGDALVTNTPGIWIGVRTADCVPILLADPDQRVIAAVHAGWRGTVDGILTKTIEKMTVEFGSDPAHIVAAIGPCIARCCFEVGQEVSDRFRALFPEQTDLRNIDLVEANRRQLHGAGVMHIDADALCTKCGVDQFHSYRRDKEQSGRMVAAIRLLSS